MFKGYLKGVTEEFDKPSRGVGDTFSKVTSIIGIKQVVDHFSEKMKKDCGCSKRTKALNEMFPYAGTIDRYIAFFVRKEREDLCFYLIDCKQHENQLNLTSFSERPIYVLRWKDERFAVAELDEKSQADIHLEDLLSLLKGMTRTRTSFRFFNSLASGKCGMTDEDVAVLQQNIGIFLRNHA